MLFKSYRHTLPTTHAIGTRFKPHSLHSRYLRQWATGWLVLNVFLFGPTIYLIQQNYSIFFHLAHLQAPYLIDHLEREQIWTYGIIFSSLGASFVWGLWLALRWSNRLFHPLYKIQEHLYQLARGRWYTPPLVVEDPEIQSVANSYNYFYRSLQIMTRQQLDLLTLIKVDTKDYDSQQALRNLTMETAQRIGETLEDPSINTQLAPTANSSEASKPSPAPRRAS